MLAIVLLVIGIFFFIGGIFYPKGDLIAIGLGIELQIIGLAIILFQKKIKRNGFLITLVQSNSFLGILLCRRSAVEH